MSSASKALRRQREVEAIFGEAQSKGVEWLDGARFFRRGDGGPRRAGWRAWCEAMQARLALRNEAILEAVWAGEPHRHVAARFGVSRATVRSLVCLTRRADPAAVPRRGRCAPPGRDEAIIRLVDAGTPVVEVTRRFDLGVFAVYALLRRRGARTVLKWRTGPPRADGPVLAALASGRTYASIAREFGVTRGHVGNIAVRAYAEGRLERRRPPRGERRAA